MSGGGEGPSAAGQPKPRWRYSLTTSLALITPLFLVYQIGLLVTWPLHNGADLVTSFLMRELTVVGYIAFSVAVAASFLVMAAQQKGKEGFQAGMIAPLLIESTIYAFFLGSAIIFVMLNVLRLPPPTAGAEGSRVLESFVMSAGAGVHEELIFRLVLMNGFVALFRWMKFGPAESFLASLIFSSTLFSAVHHLGPLGDEFTFWVFTFRVLAGIAFGVIYWFRGFAVAVYTHALYDMYVLIFR
jgi:hypothetical protein